MRPVATAVRAAASTPSTARSRTPNSSPTSPATERRTRREISGTAGEMAGAPLSRATIFSVFAAPPATGRESSGGSQDPNPAGNGGDGGGFWLGGFGFVENSTVNSNEAGDGGEGVSTSPGSDGGRGGGIFVGGPRASSASARSPRTARATAGRLREAPRVWPERRGRFHRFRRNGFGLSDRYGRPQQRRQRHRQAAAHQRCRRGHRLERLGLRDLQYHRRPEQRFRVPGRRWLRQLLRLQPHRRWRRLERFRGQRPGW